MANDVTERERLKAKWPDEFQDGARCGLTQKYSGDRERGGYPRGFHQWPLDKRNAWYAGFNVGYCDRARMNAERGNG